jgi:hypothetical protein
MLPLPDAAGQSLYILYFATSDKCADTGFPPGFHEFTMAGERALAYAVVIECARNSGKFLPFDDLTIAASHELAEAVTDPQPGSPSQGYTLPRGHAWSLIAGSEIGDLCESTTERIDGYRVQRIWSNQAAMSGADPCIPDAGAPYFNVSADPEEIGLVPGDYVRVHLAAWSTKQVPSWTTRMATRRVSATAFSPFFRDPTTGQDIPLSTEVFTLIPGDPLLNDGDERTLFLSIPFGTPAGSRAPIIFFSYGNEALHFSALVLRAD